MNEIIPWAAQGVRVRVVDLPRPRFPGEDDAWASELTANPRLHDGPLLSILDLDPASGLVTAARRSYRDLVLADRFPTGVLQFSVTLVVEATGPDGIPRVLMGRRGEQTRIYPGMWEFVPAGGLEADADFDEREVLAQARRELREETGAEFPLHAPALVAALLDHHAHSLDLVLRARADLPASPLPGSWESPHLEWVPRRDIRSRAIFPALHLLAGFLWGDAA